MTSPSLPAVVAFTRVAHHGSFTRAAVELAVSPSALSQTVRNLEAELGVRLLNRTTRRVGLTEHGARFLAQVSVGLSQIEAAVGDLDAARGQASGHLRINLSRVAIRRLVLPRLEAFLLRYPQVRVELFADDGMADLIAGGFDAGIRLGECLARDMVALPITPPQRMAVVAAPEYFHRKPAPKRPEDLIAHDCLGFRAGSGRLHPWEFTRQGRDFEVQIEARMICNDGDLLRQAALAGMGMTQLFELAVREDLAAGRLVRALEKYTPPFPGFYIYYPAREHLPSKLRVFVDFLREPAM